MSGRSVQFQVVNTQEYLILQRPISIEELPLLDFSLRSLFTLLSVDVLLQLFTCILLEHQVLICASGIIIKKFSLKKRGYL